MNQNVKTKFTSRPNRVKRVVSVAIVASDKTKRKHSRKCMSHFHRQSSSMDLRKFAIPRLKESTSDIHGTSKGLIKSIGTGKLECYPDSLSCGFDSIVNTKYKSTVYLRHASYSIDPTRFIINTKDDPKPPFKAGIIGIYSNDDGKFVLLVSSYHDKYGRPGPLGIPKGSFFPISYNRESERCKDSYNRESERCEDSYNRESERCEDSYNRESGKCENEHSGSVVIEETPVQAAIREFREETGITSNISNLELLPLETYNNTYLYYVNLDNTHIEELKTAVSSGTIDLEISQIGLYHLDHLPHVLLNKFTKDYFTMFRIPYLKDISNKETGMYLLKNSV